MLAMSTRAHTSAPSSISLPAIALLATSWGALAGAAPRAAMITAGSLLVLAFPSAGLAAAMCLELLRLLFLLVGVGSTTITVGSGVAVGLSAVGWGLRGDLRRGVVTRAIVVLLTIAGPGLVVALLRAPALSSLAAANVILPPVLALLAGSATSQSSSKRLFRLATLLMIANAIASIVEVRVGVHGLLDAGLQYGTEVREFGASTLRAPALAGDNAAAGIAAAALLVWVLAMRDDHQLVGNPLRGLAAASSGIVLVLSTSRSGLALLVVAAASLALSKGSPGNRQWSRVLIAFVAVVGFVAYGLTSSTSLAARLDVWRGLTNSGLTWFGHGLGSVGAATYSRFSSWSPQFADNYWLSVYLQFGLWGTVMTVWWLGRALALLGPRLRRQPEAGALCALAASVALTSIFVELWEYSAGMILLGFVSGRFLISLAHEKRYNATATAHTPSFALTP